MLIAFQDHDDSLDAFETMSESLMDGTRLRRRVGHPGFSGEWDVTWHSDLGVWSLLDPGKDINRFWCCFGTEDASDREALNIAVEVNPPHEGTDGRIGGAFAWGPGGRIHLTHNGRIGGGRRGIGKRAFFESYRGDLVQMVHGDKVLNVVDLGPIDSPNLPSRLAWYAAEVNRIKDLKFHGASPAAETPRADRVSTEPPAFTPEFSGSRAPFNVHATIEARADHGVVVDALAKSVTGLGYVVRNDRERDLFVLDDQDRLSVLFEVKTDVTTTSIYTAVGQLLLNRGIGADTARLILVIPGTPDDGTREVLCSLGIEVLTYHWRGRSAVVPKSFLQKVMK